jgi:hypothetical protein
VPLFPPQIPHGLTRVQTTASVMRGQQLTIWAIAQCIDIWKGSFHIRSINIIFSSYDDFNLSLVIIFITYDYSMQQRPSLKANIWSVGEEILCLLWNKRFTIIVTNSQVLFHNGSLLHSKFNTQL